MVTEGRRNGVTRDGRTLFSGVERRDRRFWGGMKLVGEFKVTLRDDKGKVIFKKSWPVEQCAMIVEDRYLRVTFPKQVTARQNETLHVTWPKFVGKIRSKR